MKSFMNVNIFSWRYIFTHLLGIMMLALWASNCPDVEANDEMTFHIGGTLEITQQPESQEVQVGESVSFSVEAAEEEGVDLVMVDCGGFWIGKYPVTQKQYQAVMGRNPSTFIGEDNPVESDTWYAYKDFCYKLNDSGLAPKGFYFDLPSFDQWVYACRAGTSTDFNNGSSDRSTLGTIAWYCDNSGGTTHPVGLKMPNAWGIYDMHGNVREWCGTMHPLAGVISYIIKGGGYDTDPWGCRVILSLELGLNATKTRDNVGFRVALIPGDWGNSQDTDGEIQYQWAKDGVDIPDATSSVYEIEKVKQEDEGNYTVTVKLGDKSITSKQAKLTLSPLSIKMHQVSDSRGYQNATASAGADEPLIPLANEETLGSHLKEVSQGLVADGVTPLVFSVEETGQTTEDHIYTIKLESKTWCDASSMEKLYVLNNGKYVQSNQLTIKAHPQGGFTTYFYLKGSKSEDISTFDSEESYSIEITSGTGSEVLATQEFKIRRPPIVFVHGFNSNGEWGSDFLSSFYSSHPTDFIYVLKYGIDSSGDHYENTYGTLKHLVGVLDKELKKNVEGKSGNKVLWDGWACSRYDMVCHSQGGVLTRMLCSQNAVWGNDVPAYRNADNNYRGRFHRIVTIGSPQNGASILYYMIQMRDKAKYPDFLKNLYQEKFDPWGPQLKEVNGKPIDPAAKFHAVRCYVADVDGISVAHKVLGLHYKMNGKTGEEIVHPYGSDGVVDMVSQMAGGTIGSLYDQAEVCHAAVANLFGTFNGETTSDFMGEYVRQLLDESASNFGSFKMPAAAPASWKAEIDRFVDYHANKGSIKDRVVRVKNTVISNTYRKLYTTLEPLSGKGVSAYAASDETEYNWFAEVYGPDGVTVVGVTVEPDPDDPMGVIVTIADSVIGDVVLYMDYQAEDEKIYAIEPTVIYSNQPGASISSIKLEPSELTLAVGDVIEPDLWVTYSNQQSCQLFISDETNVTFTSSDPKVISVEDNLLKALSAGTSVITAEYKGNTYTTQYVVESYEYEEEGGFIDYEVNNDELAILFTGALYESENGEDLWKYITAQSPYIVKMSERKKFYRSAQ